MSVLQIGRGKNDNLGIIFHILLNVCCDPSLEPSRGESSIEGSQCVFIEK